ncbi:conserved protein of unknown function [Flavobacterium collinsii]|uniref:Uncharacterized protein n=1 Tax=Flavobacterium collinsii TaxID=1114861 RepID=A0A9W4THP2_9FLAO|nr:conserved protein of unknown function [Flavobacterium collinsii]
MKLKKRSFFILAIPFIILCIFSFIGNRERQRFYNSKIESKIIDSNNWQKRTCEYFLVNDLEIHVTVLDTFKLYVGDSISKKQKSWEYRVFRKRKKNKQFEFINNYKMAN